MLQDLIYACKKMCTAVVALFVHKSTLFVHPCLCTIYLMKIGIEKKIKVAMQQFSYKMKAPINQNK